MTEYGIPGMAVGIILDGDSYVLDYGVASKATGQPVTRNTLFEIGSVSKTFTATLASLAQLRGDLLLSDVASQDLPSLRGRAFDHVTLLNLGTHTSGGLPLQVPDDVTDNARLMAYFQTWTPAAVPGTVRSYSNLSIGLLGLITADRMKGDFTSLMQKNLFSPMGLTHTYLVVPASQQANYAHGYTEDGAPIRMTPGVLAAQTYGVRTTAGDLLRFVAANMGLLRLDNTLQSAVTLTHTGYYRIQAGGMVQDLIWEQYQAPATLDDLLSGNSDSVILDPNPAIALVPPMPPGGDVLVDKTGSTDGFGTYVLFVPKRRIGIVLLANKHYPIEARVTAAYQILGNLETISSPQ